MASGGQVNGVGHKKDDRLDEADEILAAADPEEEKAANEFKETCARELKEKLDALGTNFKHNVESRFVNLEHRYGEHTQDIAKVRQTDILRLNKITRDVSRVLGTDWKNVFTFIMAGFEKTVIEAEISKIEKERPVMQAYKALMRWRTLKGEEGVDVEKLIEALQVWDKASLADHVKAILYSEGDELLQIGTLGGGLAACATKASAGASGATNDAAGTGTDKPTAAKNTAEAELGGPLEDRKLLQLAKKIGPSWFELASLLGLADEDISEIKGAEGATYQGAFKVIWMWRDKTLEDDIDQKQVLREALKAASMPDVAELV